MLIEIRRLLHKACTNAEQATMPSSQVASQHGAITSAGHVS
jgi:hypothetical protein